jgi:hypothetical protein
VFTGVQIAGRYVSVGLDVSSRKQSPPRVGMNIDTAIPFR